MTSQNGNGFGGVCWAAAWVCGILCAVHGGLGGFIGGMIGGFLIGAMLYIAFKLFGWALRFALAAGLLGLALFLLAR
jgi:hypothetical protein